MINNNPSYFEYLKNRSRISFFYRKHILYPKLSRFLSGSTLDIGCGIGDFLSFRPYSVGVDIDPAAVEWCNNLGLNAKQMEVDVLPFADQSFKSIILDNVLEHLANPNPLLKEISRVIEKNGVVIIGVPGIKGYASDSDHKKYYDETILTDLMNNFGFSKVSTFGMPVSFQLLSNLLRQYCLYGIYKSK
uniref:class I SAM-dependent methyltransferase n=1 Tax=Algoriphagus sp. TaxID=1872435 RepID=UPI004047A7E1